MDMYYGRDIEHGVPHGKKGVHFFMFEEAMKKKLAECLEKLVKETKKIYQEHHKEIHELIEETKMLNQRFGGLLKLFEKDELKEKIMKDKMEKNKDKIIKEINEINKKEFKKTN